MSFGNKFSDNFKKYVGNDSPLQNTKKKALPAITAKTGINFFSINKNGNSKINTEAAQDNEILWIDLMRPITAGSNIAIEKKQIPRWNIDMTKHPNQQRGVSAILDLRSQVKP